MEEEAVTRYKYSLIALLLLAAGLAACQPGGESQPVTQYTGQNGVTAAFDDNAPPSRVYDNQPFFVAVNLHNEGAHTINESTGLVDVLLSTKNLYYLEKTGGSSSKAKISLNGRSELWPEGEEASVSLGKYKVASRDAIGEIQEAKETFQARICYPYKTYFSNTLCIQNQFNSVQTNPICDPKNTSTFGGSGAPVAITKVQNRLIPKDIADEVFERQSLVFDDGRITGTETVQERQDRVVQQPIIKLTIRNVGDGRPMYNEAVCDEDTRQPNTVKVDAELGTEDLKCRPSKVHLGNDGKSTTRCRNPGEQLTLNTNYQSVFSANLSYNYVTTITKDINIRQRPAFNE